MDNNSEEHSTTIADVIFDAIERSPDSPLIWMESGQLSYEELGIRIQSLTNKLQKLGISRGDKIATYTPISLESCLLFWASMMLGAVYIPIDHNRAQLQCKSILNRIDPSLLYTNDEELAENEIRCGKVLTSASKESNSFFENDTRELTSFEARNQVQSSDIAVILFTSGTTDEPKGVELSHSALLHSGRLMAESYAWKQEDVIFSPGELSMMSGLRNPCVSSLLAGASFVLAPENRRNNFLEISMLIEQSSCSILTSIPILIKQFVRFHSRLSSSWNTLRMVLCTGTYLPVSDSEAFEKIFQIPLYNYYGLTETGGLCVANLPGEKSCINSIGMACGSRIKIAGTEGEELKLGQEGELWIHSNQLMTAYHNRPDLTSKVFSGGWFKTGDIAICDEKGNIFLKGRKNDTIKNVFTELIHPVEIEAALEQHSEVKEAGVTGFLSSTNEERIAAFIVLEKNQGDEEGMKKELTAWIAENLGKTRIPSRMIFIDHLPRSQQAKLDRKKLKEIVNTIHIL